MKKMTTIALFSALFLSLTSCKDGLGNYYTDYPIAGKDYVCQMTNGTRQKLAFGFSGTGIAYSVWDNIDYGSGNNKERFWYNMFGDTINLYYNSKCSQKWKSVLYKHDEDVIIDNGNIYTVYE